MRERIMNRFLASVTVGVMVLGLTACRGEVSVTPATEEDFERDYIVNPGELDYEQED
jgi:hypothetical protein